MEIIAIILHLLNGEVAKIPVGLAVNQQTCDTALLRVIDKDGYFSKPTHVYQIEIVDDGGTIYPLIDVVDFDVENDLQATKPVRKYMHIIPNNETKNIYFQP